MSAALKNVNNSMTKYNSRHNRLRFYYIPYMLASFVRFFFTKSRSSVWNYSNRSVIFLKSWTWTNYFSTSSSVTGRWFSPFIRRSPEIDIWSWYGCHNTRAIERVLVKNVSHVGWLLIHPKLNSLQYLWCLVILVVCSLAMLQFYVC